MISLSSKPRTVREIAERAGVCKLTVYRWIAKNLDAGIPIESKMIRDGKSGPLSKGYYLPKLVRGVLHNG